MSEVGPTSDERVTLRDVYDLVGRLENKLDRRLDNLDRDVDNLASRVDRMEGALGLVKWLGPAGVAALVIGLLTVYGAGLHPV